MTLTAIQSDRAIMVYGLKLSLPGQTFRIAKTPFTSLGDGHYRGEGKAFERITRAVSTRDGRLPSVETRFRFWDRSGEIEAVLTGPRRSEVRGSVVQLFRMSPTVAPGSWSKAFDGRLLRWARPEPWLIEISARTNDELLQENSRQPTIDQNTWPNAAPAAYSLVAPVCYGHHDASTSRTGPGFIPGILVDQMAYRYMICAGRAKSVPRVYVAGNQISTSLYTTEYLTTGGRLYTLIKFDDATDANAAGVATAAGVSLPDVAVTADVQGYETVGDGSGSLITNPATQIAHFLTNWVLGGYMSGSWASTHSLIDSGLLSLEEARMTALTAAGSFYRSTRITGIEALAAYCQSFERRCFWSTNFKIGLDGEKVFTQPYFGNVIRWSQQELRPLSFTEKDWRVTSAFVVRTSFDSAAGKYVQTIEIEDAGATDIVARDLERPWGESK